MTTGRRKADAKTLLARGRRRWAAATVLLALAGAAFLAATVQPQYRSTADLEINGRTTRDGGALQPEQAREILKSLHERVIRDNRESLGLDEPVPGRWPTLGFRLDDIVTATDAVSGSASSSIEFSINVLHDDADEAQRIANTLVDAYVDEHMRAAEAGVQPSDALNLARQETDRLRQRSSVAEAAMLAFEREHASVLDSDLSKAMQESDDERRSLESRLDELEARRIELDRGLRDMDSGNPADSDDALTSEHLTSLQTHWAIVRGRNGRDDPEALRLGKEIDELRAAADARFDAATVELQAARSEFQRLQQIYPIDHPDVVRQAHILSALESRLDTLKVTGLTTGERNYIENLSIERRQIDGRLDDLRQSLSSLQAELSDYQDSAAQAPLLEKQHADLRKDADEAREAVEAAQTQQDALEAEFRLDQQQRPGTMLVRSRPQSHRTLQTLPELIMGVGLVVGVLAAFLLLAVMRRIHPRISGCAAVVRLQGREPLAVIPFIHAPSSPAFAGQVGAR